MLTLSELYDPKNFVGVSQQTRTDIIQAMGFDVEGLTKNEGGKFSEEELCEGLRYLLATNKDLHSYVERTRSYSSNNSYNNPFSISRDDILFVYILQTSVPSRSSDNCGFNGGSSDNEGALILCLGIAAIAAAFGFFYCYGKNTCSTLESRESNSVKTGKIIAALSVFAATFALAYFFIPYDDNAFLRALFASPFAADAAALTSFISSKALCLPKISKPNKEILDELQTIKGILKGRYDRPEDNKEQYKDFIKAVVRYYIDVHSKDKIRSSAASNTCVIDMCPSTPVEPPSPSAPFLPPSPSQDGEYGTFFLFSQTMDNNVVSNTPKVALNSL